jgi:hypothetical protein
LLRRGPEEEEAALVHRKHVTEVLGVRHGSDVDEDGVGRQTLVRHLSAPLQGDRFQPLRPVGRPQLAWVRTSMFGAALIRSLRYWLIPFISE